MMPEYVDNLPGLAIRSVEKVYDHIRITFTNETFICFRADVVHDLVEDEYFARLTLYGDADMVLDADNFITEGQE
jgi:hypothetical protein